MERYTFKPGDLVKINDPENRTDLVHGSFGMILNLYVKSIVDEHYVYTVLLGQQIEYINEYWLVKRL